MDKIEAVAETMASIDGVHADFLREKGIGDPIKALREDPTFKGTYVALMEDASEFIRLLKAKGFEIAPAAPQGDAKDAVRILEQALTPHGDIDSPEAHVQMLAGAAERALGFLRSDTPGETFVIPQGIKLWSIGDEYATYQMPDGSHTSVPIRIYRIWESGFIAASKMCPNHD